MIIPFYQPIDREIQLERDAAVLGMPLYVGNGSKLNVNIAGPREKVVEVSVMYNVGRDAPMEHLLHAALPPLLRLLQPDWKDAAGWMRENIAKARQQPFRQIVLERGKVSINVESIGSEVSVGVETKDWRHLKVPE